MKEQLLRQKLRCSERVGLILFSLLIRFSLFAHPGGDDRLPGASKDGNPETQAAVSENTRAETLPGEVPQDVASSSTVWQGSGQLSRGGTQLQAITHTVNGAFSLELSSEVVRDWSAILYPEESNQSSKGIETKNDTEIQEPSLSRHEARHLSEEEIQEKLKARQAEHLRESLSQVQSVSISQYALDAMEDVLDTMKGRQSDLLPGLEGSFPILQDCKNLRELSLAGVNGLSDTQFKKLSSLLPGLKRLNLSKLLDANKGLFRYCKIGDSTFDLIGECCSNLESIDLSIRSEVSDLSIWNLASKCRNLKHINLADCHQITDSSLEAMGQYCRDLRSIDIFGCKEITGGGIAGLLFNCSVLKSIRVGSGSNINDTFVRAMIMYGSRLENVGLSNCKNVNGEDLARALLSNDNLKCIDLSNSVNIVKGGTLQKIGRCCRALERINLHSTSANFGVLTLVSNCQNLIDINLGLCDQIKDGVVRAIGKSCTRLERIVLSSPLITDDAMCELVSNCQNLIDINLGLCDQIGDPVPVQISRSCTRLERIDLSGCNEIKGHGICDLLSRCKNLRRTRLSGCKNIFADQNLGVTDSHLADLEPFENVEDLDLSHCHNITKQGMCSFFSKCQNLKRISLRCSKGARDDVLGLVGLHCTQLKDIDLRECSNITDEGVRKLVKSLSKLEKLNLYRCVKLTNETPIALGVYCPNLEVLNFSGNSDEIVEINRRGILGLTSGCTKLKKLKISADENGPDDLSIERLINRCLKLEKLRIRYCDDITINGFKLLKSAPCLKELVIDICEHFDYVALRELVGFPKLRILSFSFFDDSIQEELVNELEDSCKGRLYLDFHIG